MTRRPSSRDEGELLKGPRPGKMMAAALPRALCRLGRRCPAGLARPRPAWHGGARQERGGTGTSTDTKSAGRRWARPGGAALGFLGGEARRAAGGPPGSLLPLSQGRRGGGRRGCHYPPAEESQGEALSAAEMAAARCQLSAAGWARSPAGEGRAEGFPRTIPTPYPHRTRSARSSAS